MNSKALSLALASLSLATATYAVLNLLYPFKQEEELLTPPASADEVFKSRLDPAVVIDAPGHAQP